MEYLFIGGPSDGKKINVPDSFLNYTTIERDLSGEITDWISSNKQNATNTNVEGTEFVVGLDLAFHIYYTGR